MAKIEYEDKVSVRESSLPAKNVVRAEDLNEVKSSVNSLYDEVAALPDPPSVIGDLDDVDTTTAPPSVNDKLKWDGSNWVPVTEITVTNLNDLADVNAPSPTTNYYLKWDGAEWVPSQVMGVAYWDRDWETV